MSSLSTLRRSSPINCFWIEAYTCPRGNERACPAKQTATLTALTRAGDNHSSRVMHCRFNSGLPKAHILNVRGRLARRCRSEPTNLVAASDQLEIERFHKTAATEPLLELQYGCRRRNPRALEARGSIATDHTVRACRSSTY